MSFDNIFESVAAAAIAAAEMPEISVGKKKKVVIDGSTASLGENTRWRGFGMVSANNTSRLLLDYKAQHPDRYEELLNYMFGKDGLAISHLKLELGSDVNSSSGTEPCVMRYEDEYPDVTRGAGFQLAADAKKINPELTLDLLWWSEPRWVTDSSDDMAARYKWYRDTLVAAYEKYGIRFDYVSVNRNERAVDPSWIVYISHALKNEKDAPYDFSAIRIVASDEDNSWATAKKMLEDRNLLNAVDVVGSHYTSHSTPQMKELIKCHGKEAWFSEACSPMAYAKGTYRFDGTGSGLAGIGGILDIANRIITMYPEGGMTLHEFQPVVSAYYDGATFYHKQLIVANEPWSGYYLLDSGYSMALHFSQFFNKGWTFIDSACAGDGVKGGDGHAIVDAVFSYMTASDPDSGDYSVVITNTTSESIIYEFEVKNIAKASATLEVWETRGPSGGSFDENYFVKTATLIPSEEGDSYTYSLTLKPYSMVTLSTLHKERPCCISPDMTQAQRVMKLPYYDDFSYAEQGEGFLASRGGAPLYTTDQGGAFEVVSDGDRNILMQKITEELKAVEWGYTPKPVTCFGDDRWFNYSVSCKVKLAQGDSSEIYAGCGLRYNLGAAGMSGWWLSVSADGNYSVYKNDKFIHGGNVQLQEWNSLKIQAVNNIISVWVNDSVFSEMCADVPGIPMQAAGRAALYSSFHCNCFADVAVEPVEGQDIYVTRYDCTDSNVNYTGDWLFKTIDSFKHYKRTLATGNDGAQAEITFCGTGLALLGENLEDGTVKVEIDGRYVDVRDIPRTEPREAFWSVSGLPDQEHKAVITVAHGTVSLDAIEVTQSAANAIEKVVDAAPEAAEPEPPVYEEASQPEAIEVSEQPAEAVEVYEETQVPMSLTVIPKKPRMTRRELLPIIAAAGAGVAVLAGIVIAVAVGKKKK